MGSRAKPAQEMLRALVHPVRLRIAMVVAAAGEATTATIARALQDVPQATIYRHVAAMIDAAVLEVVDERPVRGGVLRTLALSRAAQEGTGADTATLEPLFAAFTVTMTQAVASTLRVGPPPPGFGFRAEVLWLSDQDVAAFGQALRALIDRYARPSDSDDARVHDLFFALAPAPAPVNEALRASSSRLHPDDGDDGEQDP